MEVIIQSDSTTAAHLAAREIAQLIQRKPNAVLGLATGSTPLGVYQELARMHQDEGLDFSQVTTFNLDEYVGLSADHPASYHTFMHEHLFRHLNIPPAQIHIPDGRTTDLPATCAAYEQRIQDAGGIDLQVLGIGGNGHIGFNEPTSSLASRTRIETLTPQTRTDNARFFKSEADVPYHVITMGIGTIMESRECLMLAFGAHKAAVLSAMVEGPITAMIPASILQTHPQVKVFIDEAAATQLRMIEHYRWAFKNKAE